MQREHAVAGLQFAGAAAGGVRAAVAQLAGTVDAFDSFGGDAVIEGIDHATDGAAAIQQRGGAPHDLDALHIDRVQWHRMVVRQRRRIQRAHAIAQQANAVAVLAANNRSAGAWAEVGRGHPRLFVQGFTEAAFLLQGQFIALQHGGGRGQLFTAQRIAGDHLGRQFQSMGFGADQQSGGQWSQAPEGGEGHRTFLGKTAKRFESYSYNITSLFRWERELFYLV